MKKLTLAALLTLISLPAAASEYWWRLDLDAIKRVDSPVMYCDPVLSPAAYARKQFGSTPHEIAYTGRYQMAWAGNTVYLFAPTREVCLASARELLETGSLRTNPVQTENTVTKSFAIK